MDKNILQFIFKVFFHSSTNEGQWKKRKYCRRYLLRTIINPISTTLYYRNLRSLGGIDNIIKIQPNLPAKIHRPYLHKTSSVKERGIDIINHYKFIQTLPIKCQQVFFSKTAVELSKYKGKNGDDLSIFCSPARFDREGELMLSVIFNNICVCQLTFSFVKRNNMHAIFIGALQGADKNTNHTIIQQATKSSYGLFPKRIATESILSISAACNIECILAVTESSHVFNHYLYKRKKKDKLLAVYSDFWESIGGTSHNDIYLLPKKITRKSLNDIVSKKRSEYKKRYAILDTINNEITNKLT